MNQFDFDSFDANLFDNVLAIYTFKQNRRIQQLTILYQL